MQPAYVTNPRGPKSYDENPRTCNELDPDISLGKLNKKICYLYIWQFQLLLEYSNHDEQVLASLPTSVLASDT
ncbi:hypothetical protein CLAFUW4_14814 [Fulvia fulva]|nr:hypothetical protein CLAFUR0_14806 [Fulvia fulva]WPV23012.1 hypothetical protein CLAFUW4_14814 [Fulvia fulva]WPV37963.1 hypothetical protein CLAFUW7_14815 [Fulvia fulva]